MNIYEIIYKYSFFYFFFSIFQIVTGKLFLELLDINFNIINNKQKYPIYYFTGLSVVFVIVRLLNLFSISFSISLILISISFIFLLFYKRSYFLYIYKICAHKSFYSKSLKLLFVFILLFIFILFYWTQSNLISGVNSLVGSLHSPRYANIALYIIENNNIPILAQNYSQSVFISIPHYFGLNSYLFSLMFFLTINIFFLIYLINILLQSYFSNNFEVNLCIFFITLGCFSIPNNFYLLIDSGWPILLNGYSDSIIGISTFILVFIYIKDNEEENLTYRFYALIGLICFFWFSNAIQNLLYLSVLCFTHKLVNKKNKYLLFLIPFLILGIISGGMITPSKLQNKDKIPGAKVLNNEVRNTLNFKPGLPYYKLQESFKKSTFDISTVKYLWHGNNVDTNKYYKIYSIFGFEILLLPFIAIIYHLNKKTFIELNKIVLIFFITALFFVFPFSIFDQKWELSRILIVPYFFSYILIFSMFNNFYNTNNFKKYILTTVVLLFTIPTLKTYYITTINNKLFFVENLKILISPYNKYTK